MVTRREFLSATASTATTGIALSAMNSHVLAGAVGEAATPAPAVHENNAPSPGTKGVPAADKPANNPADKPADKPIVKPADMAVDVAADALGVRPLVVSTWKHGLAANAAAWKVLSTGGRALDAVEMGVRESEADPHVTSVGYGGLPDRDGHVTLDACVMDEQGRCGSVAYLQHIKHPISVARRVMEKTPHVMLVGDGALQFALAQGFPKENLLTDEARAAWEKWKASHPTVFQPRINVENHDTIGMIAIDRHGNLSGSCTTSGLSWKMPGRVGDSPIIGAGLYVDNEIGAATATGMGEAVIRAVGSFLVVELMRQGHAPQDACRLAVERVVSKSSNWRDLQVGFIAIDKRGRVGGYALQPGFDFAICDATNGNRMQDAKSHVPR